MHQSNTIGRFGYSSLFPTYGRVKIKTIYNLSWLLNLALSKEMQNLHVNIGARTLWALRPITHSCNVSLRAGYMLSCFSTCKNCSALRLSKVKGIKSSGISNGYSSHQRFTLTKGSTLDPKQPLTCLPILNQKAFKSTKVNMEESMNETDDIPVVAPYTNNLEEQEFATETVNNGTKKEESQPLNLNRKKKNIKNPLPSITIDGSQLTFVEEIKVIAEIDALIKHNRATDAFQLFNRYRRRGHKFRIGTYNQLLQGFANCGTWIQVDILLHSMISVGVLPNFQTYAFLIEACWRMGEEKKLESFIHDMDSKGIVKEHIFHESILTKSQADAVLSALKSIDPNYEPVPTPLGEETQIPDSALLRGLKDPVSKSHSHDDIPSDFIVDNLSSMYEKQLENEIRGCVLVPSIEKKRQVTEKELKRKELYTKIADVWQTALTRALKIEIAGAAVGKRMKYSKRKSLQHKFVPYLSLVDPKELSEIVINEILPILASQPQGVSVNYICRHLGGLIHGRYAMKCKIEGGVIEKMNDVYKDYLRYATNLEEVADVLPRVKWQTLDRESKNLSSLKINAPLWPYTVKVLVAGVLIDLFIKVAMINTALFNTVTPDKVPALVHGYSSYEGRRFGILKIHPAMSRLYKSYLTNQGDIAMETEKVPMLVPPRPWTSTSAGGYLVHPVPFVRTIMDRYQLQEMKKRDEEGKLNAIFDSLNFLGTTCWKINTKVLDLMISLFNDKGDKGLEIIGPDLPPLPKIKVRKDMTEEERQELIRERRAVKKTNHELFALRMDLLYKLSVANHLRESVFWLPSNIDFRGRVYPIPPHCCHMGSDVARGMLLFARGRPLGKDGLDWLKVHLINLHGSLKKATLNERVEFANGKMDEILDSADNPMNGNKWWQIGDEPWQCLAICTEIANAVRSPDPTEYICYLPVQQDGSCNGLQHYSAMGLDEYGATQVNVKPSERPQDLYGEVANLVEKKRAADAAAGEKLAMQLEGKVNRKVVKQTVMTIVYGVTFVGGRLQIEKQLRDLDVPNEILFKGSSYLVHQVFKSIGELFTSARNIQDWLTIAATQISLTGQCVDWVTPLGLPITQPYHRETTEEVPTPVQNVALTTMFDVTKRPHLAKQKGGFAPNFVHSLDSCHMMLTALFCQRAGLTFASVHDSYWTHAETVPTMNKICREQFLSLHSEPILNDLQRHFQSKFGNQKMTRPLKGYSKATSNFNNLPQRGNFDLSQVINSVYFFS